MNHDEDFARTLRDRLDAVAPLIDVDTTGVVPRARRHRTRVRSVGTVAVVAALAGGGWFAGSQPWSAPHTPATATSGAPTTAPTPEESPTAEESPTSAPTPSDTPTPARSWWYTRTQITSPTAQETHESWLSRSIPGLLMDNGDTATAAGQGMRNSLGTFRIDGVWYEMLQDPELLPTDGPELAAVLRASVQPEVRNGSDDDKVFEMADDLLEIAGVLPQDLRLAVWDAATTVPGATASVGSDSLGRSGDVLQYTRTDGTKVRFVRDASTGLLLEVSYSVFGGDAVRVYLEQKTVTDIPVEPTLENSGCTSWATC